MKATIKTKSVYSPKSARDGLRVLATRFHGRGLSRDRYDIWVPSLGPSEELLSLYSRGKITWGEFSRRYRGELFEAGSVDRRCQRVKNRGQKYTWRLLNLLAGRIPVNDYVPHQAKSKAGWVLDPTVALSTASRV